MANKRRELLNKVVTNVNTNKVNEIVNRIKIKDRKPSIKTK